MSTRYLNKQIGVYLRLFFLKNAMLTIKFGQGHLYIGRFEFLKHLSRYGIRATRATKLFRFFLRGIGGCHISQGNAYRLAIFQADYNFLFRRVVFNNFSGSKRSFNDGVTLGSTILKVLICLKFIAQTTHEASARS